MFSFSNARRGSSIALLIATTGFALSASSSNSFAITGGEVSAADAWKGVGMQKITFAGGTTVSTGTLIDPTHVLTAAHVMFHDGVMAAQNGITFSLPESSTKYTSSAIAVEPSYSDVRGAGAGYDIAVVTLSKPVVGGKYWAYNTGQVLDETQPGLIGFIVGYGLTEGTNPIGSGTMKGTTGTKHDGENQVDRIGDGKSRLRDGTADHNRVFPPSSTLVFDFDSSGTANSSRLTNVNDTTGVNGWVGNNEADTAPGDSGGPMFQFDSDFGDYLITGITSYGSDGGPPATDPLGGSRFGDIAIDTRVQDYASFITAQLPEPSCAGMVISAAGTVMKRRRRAR